MSFPSDLTNSQWKAISAFLPVKTKGIHNLRSIINALFYIVKTGCPWRYLPRCFPLWQSVYYHFRRLQSIGVLNRLMSKFRTLLRVNAGKSPQPSVALIDSQSIRTAAGVSKSKGWDGAKRLVGRKRHLVTDTLGLPLALCVTSASASDREGMAAMTPYLNRIYNLKTLFADSGYMGIHITDARLIITSRKAIADKCNSLSGVLTETSGTKPKRWVVERSFAWIGHYRRLAKDFERHTASSEAMIKIVFISIMLRRLNVV
ncbi:IS5 family transposase [Taibaiella soli]|uniref:IS5 family transposase n=1 Tax=Taibaiella soli TaxID=1649169 RepID=A0A2W2BTK6_9BACT|nr:IS5 family transposase [Taibaiella soli]PZF71123.1 IS5 family transposase [Taibaiella soli]